MWILVLLLDGDYVACGSTGWKGDYVFDAELNRSWCKPTEVSQNEGELRDLTQKYVHDSQETVTLLWTKSRETERGTRKVM
ncbi:unnamed protein product [Leuciscus chuanchicus]